MKKLIFIFVGSLMLSSCATLFTGSSKTLMVKSNENAELYMNGNLIGKTNQYVDVKRTDLVKYFEVKKEGCATQGYEMPIKTNPAYWVNIPFVFLGFGLLGATVDLGYNNHYNTMKEHQINIDCK